MRMTVQGKALLVKASKILELSLSDILRKVALQMQSGRIRLGENKYTVDIIRKSGAVVNIKIDKIYYNGLSEMVEADIQTPKVRYQSYFREAVIAACLDLVQNNEAKYNAEQAVKKRCDQELANHLAQKALELRSLMY